jgi:hypothetical protein
MKGQTAGSIPGTAKYPLVFPVPSRVLPLPSSCCPLSRLLRAMLCPCVCEMFSFGPSHPPTLPPSHPPRPPPFHKDSAMLGQAVPIRRHPALNQTCSYFLPMPLTTPHTRLPCASSRPPHILTLLTSSHCGHKVPIPHQFVYLPARAVVQAD